MEFHSKYINHHEIQIKHNNKTIADTAKLKFLGLILHNTVSWGLILHNTVSWKTHIDILVSKLSKACCTVRVIRPFLSLDSLKIIYHVYFHSVITYGLIFWGTLTTARRFLDFRSI
jgi:hypothetical protein